MTQAVLGLVHAQAQAGETAGSQEHEVHEVHEEVDGSVDGSHLSVESTAEWLQGQQQVCYC